MSIREIVKEEWWPVLELHDAGTNRGWQDGTADLPDDLIARYEMACAEFEKVQAILRGYLDEE